LAPEGPGSPWGPTEPIGSPAQPIKMKTKNNKNLFIIRLGIS